VVSNESGWLSPAKINLFLHITGRRADGYHELQTVFQLLDYGDLLRFEVTDDSVITLATPLDGVNAEDNLVVRAARALQQHTGCQQGATIYLEKNLPLGGGLGGGSSNAATVLRALNALWNTRVSVDTLALLGLQLGADVPVFVRGRSAWAEGVGEVLTEIELPECWYVVVDSAVHVSTVELFAEPALTRDCPPITIRGFQGGDTVLVNVFEPLVCSHYPAVAQALAALSKAAVESHSGARVDDGLMNPVMGCGQPMMTGTGSCVFMRCDSERRAQSVLSALSYTQVGSSGGAFVAKGINALSDSDDKYDHCQ